MAERGNTAYPGKTGGEPVLVEPGRYLLAQDKVGDVVILGGVAELSTESGHCDAPDDSPTAKISAGCPSEAHLIRQAA